MAITPEGRVKKKIKALLTAYEKHVWYDMPVPGGYGKSTVDFYGLCRGQFFAVEAKAHGKHPTKLQQRLLREIRDKGGATFIIGSDHGTDDSAFYDLEAWLEATTKAYTEEAA